VWASRTLFGKLSRSILVAGDRGRPVERRTAPRRLTMDVEKDALSTRRLDQTDSPPEILELRREVSEARTCDRGNEAMKKSIYEEWLDLVNDCLVETICGWRENGVPREDIEKLRATSSDRLDRQRSEPGGRLRAPARHRRGSPKFHRRVTPADRAPSRRPWSLPGLPAQLLAPRTGGASSAARRERLMPSLVSARCHAIVGLVARRLAPNLSGGGT